jgi:alkyl hydroperoxide reductase subunit AhpF
VKAAQAARAARATGTARATGATGTADYDAIVVGGGHNGLVAAAYLARSGARTLVSRLFFDRAEVTGEFIDTVVTQWLALSDPATITANNAGGGKGEHSWDWWS